MNWEIETITRLKRYPFKKRAIANIQDDLKELEESDDKILSYNSTRATEDKNKHQDHILSKMTKKSILTDNLKECIEEVRLIDEVVELLGDKEREIIKLMYLSESNYTTYKVAERLGLKEYGVKKFRRQAIENIATFFYGNTRNYWGDILGVKEKLEEVERLRHYINYKKKQLKRLVDERTYLSAINYDKEKIVTSKNTDPNVLSDKIMDLEMEIEKEIVKSLFLIGEIEDMIHVLPPLQSMVIQTRYIEGRPWKEIINEMGYSSSKVFGIHRKAIKNLGKIYDKPKNKQ